MTILTPMRKLGGFVAALCVAALAIACDQQQPTGVGAELISMKKGSGTGFDEFGYNYGARVFVGPADGVDRILDGAVWGDPLYAKDHLKMKWSKAWDAARFHSAPWTPEAWEDNQWNGQVPGGSGETWHYRIKWIGDCGAAGTRLDDGGYCIWGQFEVIMSHGTVANEHFWDAHAVPTGYGTGN
jgi:hypothetical protein